MKAKLCKRLNTYIIESCDNCRCDWYKAQGIGSLTGNTATAETVFDGGLVINGSFDADSDWVKEASWSIENGKATYDAITNVEYIYQNLAFQSGKNYKITFTVSDVDEAGGKQAFFALWTVSNGSENVFSYTKFNNGTYTFYYTSVSGNIIYFNALNSSNGGAFSIDNISVKEVL